MGGGKLFLHVTVEGRDRVDLAHYDGYELGVVKEKMAHLSTLWNGIERVAYVLDVAWMSNAIQLVDAVTPMHLRAFGHDQADDARSWLLSETVEEDGAESAPAGHA